MTAVLAALCTAMLAGDQGAAPPDVVSLGLPGRANATPWVAADGAFVAVVWGATGDGGTDVLVATSRDGGRVFGPPVPVNSVAGEARLSGEMPPRVAVVPADPGAVPGITVLWTAKGEATAIKMARSRDGGRTFDKPTTLQADGAPGDRGWPALTLDPHGTAHAIWLDHRGLAAARADGGGPARHQPGAAHDGAAMAQRSSLYYASGQPALAREHEVTRGVCYCCKTALAMGADGTIAAAWRHVYPGNLRDIAFVQWRMAAGSFPPPVRVSEDGWAINGCPDDGPAMAVDADGTVHLVWPTLVGGASPEGALFHASTRDGRTFTARTRIPTLGGPKPSHPQVVVGPGGRMLVAWDESLEGRRVAAAREVRMQSNRPASFGEIVQLDEGQPATYPVLAVSGTRLIAVWTGGGERRLIRARVMRWP